MIQVTPPRYEDECPEDAKILADLCTTRAKQKEQGKRLKPIILDATEPVTEDKTVGRNDSCPCGSGKKFKKCCL